MTREEAIGKINAIKKYLTAGNPIWDVREIDVALNMAIKALDNWNIYSECSECGCTTKMRGKTKYCPNCGAKMDKGGAV